MFYLSSKMVAKTYILNLHKPVAMAGHSTLLLTAFLLYLLYLGIILPLTGNSAAQRRMYVDVDDLGFENGFVMV